MKIFILIEHTYNGSHLMNPIVTGLNANDFNEAKNKLRSICLERGFKITEDSDDEFSYYCAGGYLPSGGTMKNKELDFLK